MNDFTILQRENLNLKEQLIKLESIILNKSVNGIDTIITSSSNGLSYRTSPETFEPYRYLVEQMQEGALTINSTLVITYCNRYFGSLLNKSSNHIAGKTIDSFIDSYDTKRFLTMLKHSRTQPVRGDIHLLSSEQQKIPVSISIYPINIGTECLTCMIVTDQRQKLKYEKILKSEQLYRYILNQVNEAIIVCDTEGTVIKASHLAEKLCKQDILYKKFAEVFTLHYSEKNGSEFDIERVFQGEDFSNTEMILSGAGGEGALNILFSAKCIYNNKKKLIGCVAMMIDISPQKQIQCKLQQSVEEKELLLKEVHHRVKNNLTIINSLVGLQVEQSEHEKYRSFLCQLEQRILSMALIYEQLHISDKFDSINLSLYLYDLINSFISAFNLSRISIRVDIIQENLHMSIDKSITLGLIITELITNSIKHAFPDDKNGNVLLSVRAEDENFIIIIEDDGIGFDAESFDELKSVGVTLIQHLTLQLKGKLTVVSRKGTTVTLRFPR